MYPFFAGCYTNIAVNSCNTKRISSLKKSLSETYVHIPGCQKNGTFHIGIQKNRTIHILFVERRGATIYLAVLKKGAIRHAHPYYAIYRKFLHPPPPAPPPPTHTEGLAVYMQSGGTTHAQSRQACACSSPMQVRQACAVRLCKSAKHAQFACASPPLFIDRICHDKKHVCLTYIDSPDVFYLWHDVK